MPSPSSHLPKIPFSSSSYSKNLSKTTIQNLLKSGFSPTIKALNCLLLSLSKTHRFQSILHIFSQLSSNNIKGNYLTYSIISKTLLKQSRFEETEHFIVRMSKDGFFPEKGVYSSLIQGFCSVEKDPESAFSVLHRCLRNHGIFPSRSAFYSLIFSFCTQGKMDRAIEVLEMMVEAKIKNPFDDFVCSSIISGFCKIGKPEIAFGFYENAVKNGFFQPNVVTYTAVVNALCKEGRIEEVSDLVCEMEKKGIVLDAVFYSSWICGYFREGVLDEAFRRHRLMVENGIKPDTVSYTILVDGFSKEGNVEKAAGFLSAMEKDGLVPNLVTYTSIMRGFCKKGKLEEAFGIFRKVEEMGIGVDEITYAVLIDGLCQEGDLDQVFCLLEEMEAKGIGAGIVTYNTVINGLCKLGKTHEADRISRGILGDNFTYSSLMDGYIKGGDIAGVLETKRRLEEAGVCMDVVMCNVLMKALFMMGQFEDAYKLYKGMGEMGLVANSITFCIMIDGSCTLGRIDEALEIFDDCRRAPSVCSTTTYNSIIRGLCREGMVDIAIEAFNDLTRRGLDPDATAYMTLIKAKFEGSGERGVLEFLDVLSELEPKTQILICNKAICFLCKRGCVDAASDVYMLMRRKGLVVRSKSYYQILKGLICKGNKQLVQVMLNSYIKEYGILEYRMNKILVRYLCKKDVKEALQFLDEEENISVSVLTELIDALTKEGRVRDAHKLVMEAEGNGMSLDVVVYSIVVDGLCKEGYLEEALNLCVSMRKKGIQPNIVTYNSVIDGLCRQGCLVEAFRLFDSLEKNDMIPTIITHAILIGALSKEGFLEDAAKLFEKMLLKGLTPNTHIYNSLINGYCRFGSMEEALKLLSNLERSCLQPDAFTVSALINGCCRKADMEGALGFYGEFKRNGVLPDYLGFLNLIGGLCTKGRMEEARSILREMLQSQSVAELINKAGDEINIDSLTSFLNLLCEQGSIQEAAHVLGEVGSLIFPLRTSTHNTGPKKLKKLNEGEAMSRDSQRLDSESGGGVPRLVEKLPRNFGSGLGSESITTDMDDLDFKHRKEEKEDGRREDYDLMGKSKFGNFIAYYSVITLLCSKGELQKANTVAKEMLLDLKELG
ncbi:pentatricopeptide repeat-containing protein At5g57250, mitochondrial [Magnolia sinica]|uniref:pentatricopeptide repeat-containing protein At5g57250, mitochondrial n=1 Tax=Magnolia sinica TaxID=86752 RepID=UPI0026591AC1|nr:pentatricopeptide repeat-containing protein At5g57250, mitochondrial [Magnolia sinica]